MMSSTAVTQPNPSGSLAQQQRRDRVFYTSMAAAILVAVLAGFAPTYFLPLRLGAGFSALIHVHAAASMLWLALIFAQTALLAAGRGRFHRQLGAVAAALLVGLVLLQYATAIAAARRGFIGPAQYDTTGTRALSNLIIPLGDLLIFSLLMVGALVNRRNPEVHKRLMLLGAIAFSFPGTLRLLIAFPAAGLLVIGTLLSAAPVYERLSHGRIHRIYKWGPPLMLLSFPSRLALAETDAWIRFASWLTG